MLDLYIYVSIETLLLKTAMSQITIQCRLIANEPTRRQLWELMAQKNTPLINELLEQVGQHPDFPTWRQNGKLPAWGGDREGYEIDPIRVPARTHC